MGHAGWIAVAVFLLDLMIRIGLSVRVIMRRLPVGVGLAWLVLILVFPFVGAATYLILGEYRLGHRRTRRAVAVRAEAGKLRATGVRAAAEETVRISEESARLARLGTSVFRSRLLPDNRVKLLPDAATAFPSLIADIDRAVRTCHLEFYIWSPGGMADEVANALRRAAGRGVVCRVLVDAFGSAAFLISPLAKELREAGVRVQAAMRSGPARILFTRPDLRLHRKIAVIDRYVAYTGSLNIADPRYFKRDTGVGPWVDAMMRIDGPAAAALDDIMLQDWAVEANESLESLYDPEWPDSPPVRGNVPLQVFSSGPFVHVQAIEQLHVAAIHTAQRDVVMTTPYFVPTESLLLAMLSAAGRGVRVTLIVPARVDSRLTHYASRAHQADLLQAGAEIALFGDGLLHTKSLTVDGAYSLFGSVNLDPRSLHLDFEVTMAVYDTEFTSALRALQHRYLQRSEMLDLVTCRSRSPLERFTENAARLAGPVL